MTHTWQMSRQRRGEVDWWWTCSTTWTPSCQWRLCGARGSCWWLSWPHSTGPPCRILLSLGRCYSLNILVKNLHIWNNTLWWVNKRYNMFTWRMSNSNICMTLCQLTLDEGGTGTITQHPPAASTAHTQDLVPLESITRDSHWRTEDK